MIVLSIIIPVYNVEKYLRRCLDSIYTQQISEESFEVIAINDGSPDHCLDILREYQYKYKNLVVLDKANGGVSSARNAGLIECKGEYVTFVDSDDYVVEGSLRRLDDILPNRKYDLIICNSISDKDGSFRYDWRKKCKPNKVYTGSSLFDIYHRGSACGVLYKKSFIDDNQLVFPLGVTNSEDSIFITRCMSLAQTVIFEDLDLYSVYSRAGSASRSIDTKTISRMRLTLDYIQQLRIENRNKESARYFELLMYSAISGTANMAQAIPNFNVDMLLNLIDIDSYLPIQLCLRTHNAKIKVLNKSFKLFYWLVCVKYLFKKVDE